MNRLSRIFFLSFNRILALCLTCLGFASACSDFAKEYGTPNVEYGTPTARFVVSGKVSSSVSKQVVKNIRLSMAGDTTYSAADGTYKLDVTDFPDSHNYLLKAEDIDGIQNGEYTTTDTTANFANPKFTGGDDHWFEGEATIEMNVTLKPKVK